MNENENLHDPPGSGWVKVLHKCEGCGDERAYQSSLACASLPEQNRFFCAGCGRASVEEKELPRETW